MPAPRRVVAAAALSLVLTLSTLGCGSGGPSGTGAVQTPRRATHQLRLPSLQLLDVGSGRTVDLARYQPKGKPLLVWAWAPYCPYCRREAPAVESFARLHRDVLQIVGVGTQNTAAEAREFRRQTGIRSFPLLYEADGFQSWRPFGFVAQPAAALLASDGRLLRVWSGPFDEAEVLRLVAA
ncbi:MAG: TlpA family protein disulfide reductase [Actinomycetota bacterium]|nr:TlpA family protein disulfide reductase [Actinomycetota bacterium]